MKLWQKLFVCSLALLLIAVNTMALILLNNSHARAVESEKQRAAEQFSFSVSTMKSNLSYARLAEGSSRFGRQETLALLSRVMQSQTQAGRAGLSLYEQGQRLLDVHSLPADLERGVVQAALADNGCYTELLDWQTGTFLLMAAPVTLENQGYLLVSISDVSDIFTAREHQLTFVRQTGAILSAALAGILLVVVFLLLRPLSKIAATTKDIAAGDYTKRLPIHGRDELNSLASNMNTMAAAIEENVTRLQRVAEGRKQFSANLAHEMKTPLTSILGYADILRIKRTVTDVQRQEYAGIIVEEAQRLRTLSAKLMLLQSVGTARLDLVPVDLCQLAEETARALAPAAKKAHVTLRCQCEQTVLPLDRELFKALLANLCDNALKASSPGGEVLITTQRENGTLQLCVRDCGFGMAPEELSKITEPFYTVDKARTRKAGGAGLGLSLCREIAAAHGCTLRFESSPGEGTTAFICFAPEGGTSR